MSDVTARLAAFVVGLDLPADEAAARVGGEVAARVERALGDEIVGGWDVTSVGLALGSAAATARTLALTPDQTAQALSVAATQVSGFAALAGTPLGDYQERHAVRQGEAAATLVGAGLEAPTNGLEGRRGLFALLAPLADADRVVHGLGDTWVSEGDDHADD